LGLQEARMKTERNAKRYHILTRYPIVQRQLSSRRWKNECKINVFWIILAPGGVTVCSLGWKTNCTRKREFIGQRSAC